MDPFERDEFAAELRALHTNELMDLEERPNDTLDSDHHLNDAAYTRMRARHQMVLAEEAGRVRDGMRR